MLKKRFFGVATVAALGVTVALTGAGQAGAQPVTAEQAQQTADEPTLYYNHSYAVIDAETAEAIDNSEYLRDFANFEIRTTTGAELTWSGSYIYGSETYFEFFAEGELPGQDANYGSSSLALSAEYTGGLQTATERLTEAGVDPLEFRQTRDFGDGVPVGWFDGFNMPVTEWDTFGAWAMEYLPEYFEDPRSNTDPAAYPGDISRERYQTDDYQDHLMREITGLRFGVSERDLSDNLPLFEAAGLDIEYFDDGDVHVSDGVTEVQFDVVPAGEYGLQWIKMALNESQDVMTEERIGNSTLSVGPGARAVWTFEQP
ncbi:DUF5829 family protein [Streptomyces sp. RFCAC02]|uniref:DUF5829 family protein n=1 Tax=Streptomyces sp. RFCAC02 TaxID=2499143 RepID=UPI00101F5EF4|nr:DUF5829 family protein [Streptomyces sp. RFCAC02]